MIGEEWALPGDLRSATWFGEQFHAIHDLLLPAGPVAEQTAAFLRGLVNREAPTATEFGVGTGRIALPLARRGVSVVGVDSSSLMLDVCRAAMSPTDPGLRLVEADMRDGPALTQADLVYCVNGTLSLLQTADDVRRAARTLASAVRPGGAVVIEENTPAVVRLLHHDRMRIGLTVPLHGLPASAEVTSLYDHDTAAWQLEYRWVDGDGVADVAIERMSLLEPEDLVETLTGLGLSWRATYADWTSTPASPSSPTYVCVFSAPDAH